MMRRTGRAMVKAAGISLLSVQRTPSAAGHNFSVRQDSQWADEARL